MINGEIAMVKSFREFADELDVTIDAVHKMRKRNEDIAVHCFKQGNRWKIDETGQQLIRERSFGKPKSQIADASVYEELDKYKTKVIELQEQVIKLQALSEGFAATKLLAENLEKEKEDLVRENDHVKKEKDELKEKVREKEEQQENIKSENEQLKEELSQFERTWFGLYRRK